MKNESLRFRFSVPDKDETVLNWVNEQANLSFSIRMIIKEYVETYGCTDATCRDVVCLPKFQPSDVETEVEEKPVVKPSEPVIKPSAEEIVKEPVKEVEVQTEVETEKPKNDASVEFNDINDLFSTLR